ncbi:MAG TPA: chemotaxis protein CheA [Pseudomonas sp.]|uniref:chemotaxis protein CheA n=1 Tax=Pseudomonas sp. TaxID=306 RepID=UPI002B64316F|nr:chemotaxis protein CheA [Pseudomonas sp.]HRL92878.1 chemotaxis protein CheA [Pseudomonas sp.]
MTFGMSQFLGVFFEEAEEHLAALEHLLLTLDVAQPDAEALNGIFRAAHSIKGSSGMFGFDDLTAVTHVLETLLDKLRSGQIALQAQMIDVLLEARDVLAQLLAAHKSETPDPSIAVQATVTRLQALIDQQGNGSASAAAVDDSFGFFDDAPGAPAAATATATAVAPVEQAWGLFADEPAVAPTPAADSAFGFFDDAPGAPSTAVAEQAYGLFPDAPGAPLASAPAVAAAPAHDRRSSDRRAAPAAPAADAESSSIRVSVERIDSLINQVGELVITQAMLAQLTSVLDPAEHERIYQALTQLEHNTRELQEAVMSIRMLPISFVFNRFPRLVRDTCGKLGKQVELVLRGEHTELDKGVIEKLTDPLTHIVRNSIDHGIELPAERLAAGKPAMGTVRMSAFHQGGRIVVEISDDGKGLSRERILAKAKEQGMPVSDEMPDSEVWQLIFMPGFSTAEAVTDLSGRGVGMDVVRRNITSIGGRIDINSVAGQGTHIAIRLPLTLAILDGMIVEVDKVHYVVPLTYIVESLQLKAEHIYSMSGSSSAVISVRNEYLPLLSLHRLLNLAAEPPPRVGGIVLILEAEGNTFALQVDDLIGQQQVVIKSLEQNFRRVDGITGATIMGDGSVALILDVDALPRLASQGTPNHA